MMERLEKGAPISNSEGSDTYLHLLQSTEQCISIPSFVRMFSACLHSRSLFTFIIVYPSVIVFVAFNKRICQTRLLRRVNFHFVKICIVIVVTSHCSLFFPSIYPFLFLIEHPS